MRFLGPGSVLSLVLLKFLSTKNSAEVRSQPSLAFLDCESVFTGGRAPVVGVVSLLRCRTKAGGIKRKSPHRAGVSEFLAAGVSSHYFSSPDSSLRGPTGAAVMDRYIHWGITGMKKEENHLKGSSSSIIFFYCTGITPIRSRKANALGSSIILIVHKFECAFQCTIWIM